MRQYTPRFNHVFRIVVSLVKNRTSWRRKTRKPSLGDKHSLRHSTTSNKSITTNTCSHYKKIKTFENGENDYELN